MNLFLKKLTLDNFAGIKHQEFKFDKPVTKIYGANGSGKTTTAIALQWLLFDKGLDGKTTSFHPVPLDENNKENYELIPSVQAVFDKDGEEIVLRKESHPNYKSNKKTNRQEYDNRREKKFSVNEESLILKNYKAYIQSLIDENVFKLVTNPNAFNQLDWKKRREILFEISGDVDDDFIINSDPELKGLEEILGNHEIETKKKILRQNIRAVDKKIKDLPVRINEQMNSIQEVEPFDKNELKQLDKEIEELQSQIIAVKNGGAVVNLRNELSDKRAELKRLEQSFNNDIDSKISSLTNEFNVEEGTVFNYASKIKHFKQEIDFESKRRDELLKEYKQLKNEIATLENKHFEYTESNICPCCGQPLPPDQVAEAREKAEAKFNKEKASKLESLNEKASNILKTGKSIKPTIENLENEIATCEGYIEQAHKKSNKIKEKLDALKTKRVDVSDTDDYKAIIKAIADINDRMSNLSIESDEQVASLEQQIELIKEKKQPILNAMATLQANKHAEQRIFELRNQEDKLLNDKERQAEQLYILDKFTETKINMLTESINKKFKLVKFKVFDELVDGTPKETCKVTVGGVEFSGGLNTANEINAGLEIMDVLGKFYGVTAPIIIDNAESVTDIRATDAQQILLYVSENDKKLRIED